MNSEISATVAARAPAFETRPGGQRAAVAAAAAGLATLVLTSVHHAYGAYIYATPWRYHAVYVSAGAALVILSSFAVFRGRPPGLPRTIAIAIFVLATLAVPVLMFGLFEGAYNHALKDALYFGGASADFLQRLFPAPRYEMPNDVIFEVTGVLQVAPAAVAAWQLYRMLRPVRTSAGGERAWAFEARGDQPAAT